MNRPTQNNSAELADAGTHFAMVTVDVEVLVHCHNTNCFISILYTNTQRSQDRTEYEAIRPTSQTLDLGANWFSFPVSFFINFVLRPLAVDYAGYWSQETCGPIIKTETSN